MPQLSEGLAEMHETLKEIRGLLRTMAETHSGIPKELLKLHEHVEYLGTKAANIELRQCMTRGEGTDSTRMTINYIKGASAVWPSGARGTSGTFSTRRPSLIRIDGKWYLTLQPKETWIFLKCVQVV